MKLAPKTKKTNNLEFLLSQSQIAMVSRVEQTLSVLGQNKSYSNTLRDAMPMCLLHAVFDAPVPSGFATYVSDASFQASLYFVARRCVRGIAVLRSFGSRARRQLLAVQTT